MWVGSPRWAVGGRLRPSTLTRSGGICQVLSPLCVLSPCFLGRHLGTANVSFRSKPTRWHVGPLTVLSACAVCPVVSAKWRFSKRRAFCI